MTDLRELLQVVDKNDHETGAAPKSEVWAKGLIHRVVRIIVFSADGRFLMQKRGAKPLYPFRWDVGVAGHVAAGEDYEVTARREAEEEIGVHDLKLRLVGKAYQESIFDAKPPVGRITMRKFAQTYRTTLEWLPTKLGKGEVTGVEWWDVANVKKLVAEHPEQVTDSLRYVATHYL